MVCMAGESSGNWHRKRGLSSVYVLRYGTGNVVVLPNGNTS
ncbi:MAG: hypothetical protein AB4080_03375 [Trichodesmium sp.]